VSYLPDMNTTFTQPRIVCEEDFELPAIFERLARQEAGAFDEFLARYGNLVAFLVRKALGSRTNDFDDAVQDALLALWRAAPRFDRSRGGETTFIGTIVRRLMIDRRRKAKVRAAMNLADSAQLAELPHQARGEPGPCLHAALKRLRPMERAVVELAVVRGKTHDQIAHALNMPAKAVKHTVHAALTHLRQDPSLRLAAA
jgi:RNA polymerase sigma-70 factor, ECF subfamily